MKATKEQIEKAIAYAKKERARLPEYSVFGDNNWKTLDNEIEVLEEAVKGNLLNPRTFQDDKDSTLYYLTLWLHNTSDSEYGTDRDIE